MREDLVGPLGDGNPLSLRGWLEGRHVDVDALRGLPRWNAEPAVDGVPSARRPPNRLPDVIAVMRTEIPKVRDAHGGVARLLSYLLYEVEAEWETSYHFRPLWDTLRGAGAYVRLYGMPGNSDDAAVAEAVLALMECVDCKIRAENAMTTGQFAGHVEAAEFAVSWAQRAVDRANEVSVIYPELAAYILEAATEHVVYNGAVARTVRAALEFFESGAPLDSVISDLLAAEEAVRDETDRSELRAHRFSLGALNHEIHSSWLRVDRGKLVYMYPFAIRGTPPERVVTRAGEFAKNWPIAGVKPVLVLKNMNLDDVWDGSDSLGRRYAGALVQLPEVLIRDFSREEIGRVTAELRLSALGNHYVRFEAELVDASPADLYAMMFRAAPEHGTVRVAFEGTPQDAGGQAHEAWPRLSDLAMDMVEDLCAGLRRPHGTSEVRAVARPGMFQVVVLVDAASTGVGPAGDAARREVRSLDDLATAVGVQVLANPVTYLVGAVAEWIRYSADHGMSVVSIGMTQDRTLRTPNTTVVASVGTADFVTGTRATLAEFAASLDGLFAGWSDELAGHYNRVKELQRGVSGLASGEAPSRADLVRLSDRLSDEKIRLTNFALEARSTMALIRSPSLVASPVAAESLRVLLDGSDFQRRVDELTVKMDEVVHEQLGVTIEKLAGQRVQEQRAKLELFLAVIAAAGFSGIIQVLQSRYGAGHLGRELALGGVSLIFVLAVALVFWVKRAGGGRAE